MATVCENRVTEMCNKLPRAVGSPAVVYLVFFISGFAALVNEISWARQLGVVLGHTVDAATIVLTAYFAGLSLGYGIGGRIASRVRPLTAYAICEFIVAGWSFIVPLALEYRLGTADVFWSIDCMKIRAQRWLFCFVVLLPATVAMGATLPFIAEWLSRHDATGPRRIVRAYAVNTIGALAGVAAAPMWLLLSFGIRGSSYFAAILCIVCGLLGVLVQSRGRTTTVSDPAPSVPPARITPRHFIAVSLSGFGVLALEVLYTRLFSLVFHNSTYTFAAILAMVLVALSLGALVTQFASRFVRPDRLLVAAAALGAIFTAGSVVIFARVTRFEYQPFGDSFTEYLVSEAGLVAIVVLPPIITVGMMLPIVWLSMADGGRHGGSMVGKTTVLNALAGAAGAAVAGLVLIPRIGLWQSFALVAGLFLVFALLISASRGWWGITVVLWFTFLIPTIPILSSPGPERWARTNDEHLVQRWNSAYGWVDVVGTDDHVLKVRQNLHYRHGTTGTDAPRAHRQAHMPLLLHPRPSDVLFLGLGTGLTAAGAIHHPEVERAVIVELIPEVVEASRLLSDANGSVVDHPKFEMRIDDARHYLTTTNRQFDVIISDLFVPWESEAGYLYTVEHFQAVRERLRSGGFFCLWLAVYQLGPGELEIIADSFAAVFPEATLWWGHLDAQRPIVGLIGGDLSAVDSATIDARLSRLWQSTRTDGEIETVQKLLSRCIGQWNPRNRDRLNTDEHPRIEFLAPISHIEKRLLQGSNLLQYYDTVLTDLPGPESAGWAQFQQDWHRSQRHRLSGSNTQ